MESLKDERIVKGAIILPHDSEHVVDADEEIFLIYTELLTEKTIDSSQDFRGLGYLDSHKDTLELKFDVVQRSQPNAASGSGRGKRKKENRPVDKEKSIEITLSQDKTALHSRKGDTGSVVWKASMDFAQFVLQSVYSQSTDSIFDPHLLKQANVLELGAGTGILSIALSPLTTSYCATDIEPIMPLIRKNIGLNFDGWPKLSPQQPGSNVTAQSLDWIALTSSSPALRSKFYDMETNPVDLLLAVDCLYHPSLIPPLIETIDHLSTIDRTAVVVVSELRSEDVFRDFLEYWLQKPSWKIWRLPSRLLGKHYVVWIGWKSVDVDS